jgi:hypothetical protein
MRKFLGLMAAAICGVLVTASCGEASRTAAVSTCGKVPACGGNIVGDWTVSEACTDSMADTQALLSQLPCTGAKVESNSVKTTGTLSFGADGAYSHALSSKVSATLLLPASCLKLGPVTLSCDQLTALPQAATGLTFESLTCAAAAGGCRCSAALTLPDYVQNAGTYTTSGTALSLHSGTSQTTQYCVEGNALHILGFEGFQSGSTTIEADLVAARR